MICQNLEKTKLIEKAVLFEEDYKKCIQKLSDKKILFDIIYIDPPYRDDIAVEAARQILQKNLLKEEGIIIIETDDEERELKELEKLNLSVYDLRKYGRASLIFLNRKG